MSHVGPTGTRKVLGTTDAWSITAQTKYKEESWKVLSFLSGPVYQDKQIVAQEGIIPVLKSRIASFIDTVRNIRPSLVDVRLETISEILDLGLRGRLILVQEPERCGRDNHPCFGEGLQGRRRRPGLFR